MRDRDERERRELKISFKIRKTDTLENTLSLIFICFKKKKEWQSRIIHKTLLLVTFYGPLSFYSVTFDPYIFLIK